MKNWKSNRTLFSYETIIITSYKSLDIGIITASNGFFINTFSLCRDPLDQLDLLAKMD